MKQKFIDLGLPSGNLWVTENEVAENGQPLYATFDEAVKQYGENLPTRDDWQELIDNVPHLWDKKRDGLLFVARNGKELFLPAMGYYSQFLEDCDMMDYGFYWSGNTYEHNSEFAYCTEFGKSFVEVSYNSCENGRTIRLIKKGGKQ